MSSANNFLNWLTWILGHVSYVTGTILMFIVIFHSRFDTYIQSNEGQTLLIGLVFTFMPVFFANILLKEKIRKSVNTDAQRLTK